MLQEVKKSISASGAKPPAAGDDAPAAEAGDMELLGEFSLFALDMALCS